MKKSLSLSLILFIAFSLLGEINPVLAQTTAPAQAPETFEEVQLKIQDILRGFPWALKWIWKEALAIWKRMFLWMQDFWNSTIGPYVVDLCYKIRDFFEGEMKERKPAIEEEFRKEKEELKKEIPKAGKGIWQRFKKLIW